MASASRLSTVTTPGLPKIIQKPDFVLTAHSSLLKIFEQEGRELPARKPNQCVVYRYAFDPSLEEEEEDDADKASVEASVRSASISPTNVKNKARQPISQEDSYGAFDLEKQTLELENELSLGCSWWSNKTTRRSSTPIYQGGGELKVLDFATCGDLKKFFGSIQNKTGLPQDCTPDNEDELRGEVSMKVRGRNSVLAISIPYIAPGRARENLDKNDTIKLLDYRPQLTKDEYSIPPYDADLEVDAGIFVHKVWFLVINNETIAIAKSEGDTETPSSISSPRQTRLGAFHTAMRGIMEALEAAESELFRKVRREVADFERRSLIMLSSNAADSQEIKIGMVTSTDLLLKLSALSGVVARQAELLLELEDIFECTGHSLSEFNEHARGTINIQVLPEKSREQMRYVLKILDETQRRRKDLLAKLSNLSKVVRRSQKLYDDSTASEQLKETLMEQTMEATMTSVKAMESLDEAIIEQNQQAQSLKDEMTWQGSVLSMFTAVTVLFLPLGFFTAFFALDSVKKRWSTQTAFWTISGPVTFFMVLVTLIIIFSQEYGWKTSLRYWITPWRIFGMEKETLSEREKFEQERYFNSLPLYRIEHRTEDSNNNNNTIYLQKPDALTQPSAIKSVLQACIPGKRDESEQKLIMGSGVTKGEFRFDVKNGWLVHNEIYGEQDILCARVTSRAIYPTRLHQEFIELSWKKVRLPKESQTTAAENGAKFQIYKEQYLEWVSVQNREPGTEFEERVSSNFSLTQDSGNLVLGVATPVEISQSDQAVPGAGADVIKLVMVDLEAKLRKERLDRLAKKTVKTLKVG